jgi:hypothetical protein
MTGVDDAEKHRPAEAFPLYSKRFLALLGMTLDRERRPFTRLPVTPMTGERDAEEHCPYRTRPPGSERFIAAL